MNLLKANSAKVGQALSGLKIFLEEKGLKLNISKERRG
jgi:hypothetical protein